MKKFIFIFLLVFISSCGSSNYDDVTLKNSLGASDKDLAGHSIDIEWWKRYGDQQLNDLVDIALYNNIDLAKSALNINKSLYQSQLIDADFFPTFSAGAGASANKDIKNGTGTSKSFSGNLSLNYELNLWNKISNQSSAQEWEYNATIMDKEATRLILINSVIELYYKTVYLKASEKAYKNNIKNLEEAFKISKTKNDLGKEDRLLYLQSEQSLLNARTSLLGIKTQIKDTEQSLNNLLNLKPDETINIEYVDISKTKLINMDINIPIIVLAERPDLKASEFRLIKSFKNYKAKKSTIYPSISIGSTLSSSANNAGDMFDFPFLMGSISLNLPFLDWYRVKSNIKISKNDYKIAKLDFESTLNQALNEVSYNYVAYKNYKKIKDNAYKKLIDQEDILSYYKTRYDNGKIELSDLLTAINSKNDSQVDVINNTYQAIVYENLLIKSMAGYYY